MRTEKLRQNGKFAEVKTEFAEFSKQYCQPPPPVGAALTMQHLWRLE